MGGVLFVDEAYALAGDGGGGGRGDAFGREALETLMKAMEDLREEVRLCPPPGAQSCRVRDSERVPLIGDGLREEAGFKVV